MSSLPELFEFDSISGIDAQNRWETYIDSVYRRYLCGVVKANLQFRGQRVSCQHRPESFGKHFAFWHMMQEGYMGKREDDRTPDFERCKRVDWIGWAIQNVGNNDEVRVFRQSPRQGEKSWAIWLYKQDYVVILWERKNYYLLKTAFSLKTRKRKELQRDWEVYLSEND